MPQFEIEFAPIEREGKRQTPCSGLFGMGPVVPIEVKVPSVLAAVLQDAKKAIPKPQTGLALIDTGATKTSIDKSVIAALELPETGKTSLRHASGSVETTVHAVELGFPTMPGANARLPQAISCDLGGLRIGNQKVIALFGRDLLQQFVMIYNGPKGRVTLIFA